MYARRKPLSLDTNLAGRLTVACLLVSALAQPALVRPAHAQQSCAFADTPEENPQGIPLQVTVGAGGPQELSGWDPSIVYDATLGKYRVWYTLFVSPVLGITYAESDDGILWQKDPDAPVHVVPPSEPWDAEGPETASVVRRDGTWYLWYTAKPCNRPPGELGRFKCIGLATSTDGGNTWVKHPVPVLEHSQAWEQPFQVEEPGPGGPVFSWEGGVQEPSVVWDAGEGLFKMWYEGHSQITLPPEPPGTEPITVPYHAIGYATSTDGVEWDKDESNPVFTPDTGSWETSTFVGHTNVVEDPSGAGYHLFYFSAHSIGHAVSPDGLAWTRDPGNPLLPGRTQAQCISESEPCTPDCTNYWSVAPNVLKQCGTDTCGASCGSCSVPGQLCIKGVCRSATLCTPDCNGKACGDDGCGNSCGACTAGQVCNEGKMAFGGASALFTGDDEIRLYEMRSRQGAKFWGDGGMRLGLADTASGILAGGARGNLKTERLKLAAKDTRISMGDGAGSGEDPRVVGATLRVQTAASDDTYPLAAAGWSQFGPAASPKGWRYRDPGGLYGPIQKVVLKHGKTLKIKGRGAALGHSVAADPSPVEVEFALGGLSHCLKLGGKTKFLAGRLFKAKKAPACLAGP